MNRLPIIAGNWKMNLCRADVEAHAVALTRAGAPEPPVDVVLFPTSVHLSAAVQAMPPWVGVGAQDVHAEGGGAFTGDVAAAQVADAGASWALVGHSERREHHGESNAEVARKAAQALGAGLVPLICVGETREQREQGDTDTVLDAQLDAVLDLLEGAPDDAAARPVIAYEPVWAIGSGASASPGVAAAVHEHLRRRLNGRRQGLGDATRILYGGSVNADNCRDLVSRPDIDGFLIGGASLDPASFLRIIRVSADAAGGGANAVAACRPTT